MNGFTYSAPTKVIFGRNTEEQVGGAVRAAGGTRALVVYGGGSAVRSGLLSRVTAALEHAGLGVETAGGVKPNPSLELAQQMVDTHKGTGIDFVLAVGGGSVIDTAKAVAHGLARPETPIWDYYLGKETVRASLPKGAVLTIAAAGSETSDSAVLTREETKQKRGLNTPFNQPDFAILNPELTYSLPPRQTACGVADIMMHTLDRYFSSDTDNALTDGIAEALLRTTIEYGRVAMERPEDYKARSELMWCGSLSHNGLTGLGQPKDFSPHALGHELSGMFDLPHGESLTVMWPAWARFVCGTAQTRFAQYGRNVWGIREDDEERCALAAIRATEDYFKALGLPTSFGEAAMGAQSGEVIRALARRCSFDGTRIVGKLQPIGEEDMGLIYAAANH